LNCSLVGQERTVHIVPGSQAHRTYQEESVVEVFACNYGLNDAFRAQIGGQDLRITGHDDDGTVRIVELSSHRFFLATLFVPQMLSKPGSPHPLITAYLKEAHAFSTERM
jgi:CTP synthase (UTP-ammonia lyase)